MSSPYVVLAFPTLLLGFVLWTVTFHAKKRWPHLNWFQRWTAFVTFDAERQDSRGEKG